MDQPSLHERNLDAGDGRAAGDARVGVRDRPTVDTLDHTRMPAHPERDRDVDRACPTNSCDRRSFLAACALAGAGLLARLPSGRRAAPLGVRRVRPTAAQLRYQRRERALFLHFGVNTFTDREWGTGTESPSVFDPTALDARQWARCARSAGFRSMVLTAKHHDGFCLWPSAVTGHTVRRSPWRGGAGDVVREFTDACRAEGLGAGLYLSPWDRHERSYGDSP